MTEQQPTTLILKRFIQLQHTRLSLLNELELALSSSEPKNNNNNQKEEEEKEKEEEKDHHAPNTHSSCRHEYKDIKTNPEDYIQQVISISTSGFIEIRDEVKLLMDMLRSDLDRVDLFELIERIESLEANKMSEYLQQTLLRRKARLEERDYTELINNHQEKVDLFAKSIASLTAEVQAELAELT
ncbi:uncharacterized protein PGTG_01122 [Puccinia graminis f. sp. tritici CRL 75-36-700-3]|uniref:Uncharacterized protein n=1 Tax=Puccinia graminis f. sp. tritici (strain CRL 75-36-700-3 / race SCCL) TaxID=418459 RepID=E3JUR6_PUCGT|nr:uncharacterized protein PGTG_01122 [Puccinia graminis f. sp. tritici CRL 75-36-700-3]EFP75791.2 hypothetical protein PGTG_01122 [Puccinia graminis f. sp. tritici CRL 75-36-700-3]